MDADPTQPAREILAHGRQGWSTIQAIKACITEVDSLRLEVRKLKESDKEWETLCQQVAKERNRAQKELRALRGPTYVD